MDIEDYFDIVRRHKAWIFGPAFACLVIAVVGAFLWPDTYVSQAVIRVVPPQVPESFVPKNITTEMSQRINSMYQTISSVNSLTNTINSFNLYPAERRRMPMQDVVEMMRKSIKIGSVSPMATAATSKNKEVMAFSISFEYNDRIVAQKVTENLVSRFTNEYTRERTTQSLMTTQFLRDQLETAKKELDAIEGKLTAFRQAYQGRLPEQLQGNQVQMGMLDQRVANLNASLSRISQEKMLLESDLRTVKSQLSSLTPAPDQVQQKKKNEEIIQAERDIRTLEANLIAAREHYRDSYPEVQRLKARLASAQKMKQQLEQDEVKVKEQESKAPSPATTRMDPMYERESRQLDAVKERLESQIKAKDAEAENYRQDLQNTEKQVRSVQSRLESLPASHQQYAEVIRDRDVAKLKYDEFNRKSQQSAVSEDLEKRQQGETLEVVDPASLPQSPTQPKRPIIIGAGALAGLMLGLVLAGAREAKDTSLKNLKDVRAYTQLNILGSIPLLENDLVVRRRKRLTWLAWSTACLVGIAIMTCAAVYYYATKV